MENYPRTRYNWDCRRRMSFLITKFLPYLATRCTCDPPSISFSFPFPFPFFSSSSSFLRIFKAAQPLVNGFNGSVGSWTNLCSLRDSQESGKAKHVSDTQGDSANKKCNEQRGEELGRCCQMYSVREAF